MPSAAFSAITVIAALALVFGLLFFSAIEFFLQTFCFLAQKMLDGIFGQFRGNKNEFFRRLFDRAEFLEQLFRRQDLTVADIDFVLVDDLVEVRQPGFRNISIRRQREPFEFELHYFA